MGRATFQSHAKTAKLSRREALGALGAVAVCAVAPRALAEAIATIDSMKPGEFSWHPDRAPAGAVAIVVSLPDQRVYVYRNGVRIAVSTCSTGKPGHETPTGVFTILQKDKHHRSSTYNNAPMPNMNRLTWSGIALHAGDLPGYPASHGCVRLPMEFSDRLFTITRVGTPVIIANAATYPSTVLHPGLALSADAAKEFDAVVASSKAAAPPTDLGEAYEAPVTSILVSSAGSQMIVLDDGKVVASGRAIIKEPERPLGNHVFILTDVDPATRRLSWQTIGYYNDAARILEQSELATLDRIRGDHDVIGTVRSRMRPGTVLATVDVPLSADTRTGEDFVIITNGDEG